jgi:NTE family protein
MNVVKYSASSARVDEDMVNTKKDGFQNNMSSSSSDKSEAIENVLILQGGGSLGAFGCGVFKALSQKEVKINIVAGTSIGGVNAAIIAGSKDGNRPEQFLEQFWLELADGFVDLENVDPFLSPYMERLMANFHYFSPSGSQEVNNESKRKAEEYTRIAKRSFISSAMFGNDKMFKARWRPEYALTDPQYFEPAK